MTRPWPAPTDTERTFHVVGDTHHGGGVAWGERRQGVFFDDISRPTVPEVEHRFQVGDFVNAGLPDEDAEALAYFAALPKAEQLWIAVGNHDMPQGVRTADEAAAAWGMPGQSYSVDMGFARALVICPALGGIIPADQLAWLGTEAAGTEQNCFVMSHWPMHNTVAIGDNTKEFTSLETAFYAKEDTDIRAALASHPNIKAWISGHTHTTPTETSLIVSETLNGRAFHHINASSVAYVGRVAEPYDFITSFYLTWLSDRIEVRFRNHGGVVWDGNSGSRLRTLMF